MRSRGPLQPLRLVLGVVFLGIMAYLLKGDEFNFSIWGGLAMAAVFLGIGVLIEFIVGRRR